MSIFGKIGSAISSAVHSVGGAASTAAHAVGDAAQGAKSAASSVAKAATDVFESKPVKNLLGAKNVASSLYQAVSVPVNLVKEGKAVVDFITHPGKDTGLGLLDSTAKLVKGAGSLVQGLPNSLKFLAEAAKGSGVVANVVSKLGKFVKPSAVSGLLHAASEDVARFIPGANIAIAGADWAHFGKVMTDGESSTAKKALAGTTAALDSVAAVDIPIVSQGAGLLAAGTSLIEGFLH